MYIDYLRDNMDQDIPVRQFPTAQSQHHRAMDFDYLRDYMDQDIPVRQFPTAQSRPIEQFFSGMPLDEHDSRRPQPGIREPSRSCGGTIFTRNITS